MADIHALNSGEDLDGLSTGIEGALLALPTTLLQLRHALFEDDSAEKDDREKAILRAECLQVDARASNLR